jgi:hypothetical protein
MSKIDKLQQSYKKFIEIPWKSDIAPAQRVIFCVYNEHDELSLRAKIDEFELATKQANHRWLLFDLTNTFPEWLGNQKYATSYFKKPDIITQILPQYPQYIKHQFLKYIEEQSPDDNSVVALSGVGTLFGLIKVKELVDALAPLIKGRLVIFFPGSYEGNNYRLLDGYDGWNYLAVPITADKEF